MKPTEEMINRFLQWKLPENFRPDCGIIFDANAAIKLNPNNHKYEPVGTNLFDYEQAKQMLEFVLETTEPKRESGEQKLLVALQDSASQPCSTAGVEDSEVGCCCSCRARALLREIEDRVTQ
jgi:hypothetical protein